MKLLIVFELLYRLAAILYFKKKKYSFQDLMKMTSAPVRWRRQLTETEVEFSFRCLRKITTVLNLATPCVLVSMVLFWMSPGQSKLFFSQTDAHDFHMWVELNSKKLSTDYQLNYSDIHFYEKTI